MGSFPEPGETQGAPDPPPSPRPAQDNVLPSCTQQQDRRLSADFSPVKFPLQTAAQSRTCSVPLKTPEDRPSHHHDLEPRRTSLSISSMQITSPKDTRHPDICPRAIRHPLVPSPVGLAEVATLPPCLQKPLAERWPGTPPARRGETGADLPPTPGSEPREGPS